MFQYTALPKELLEGISHLSHEEIAKELLADGINFLNQVGKSCYSMIEDTNTEFDLTKKYIINWVCIFNDKSLMGSECTILAKDSKIAMVLLHPDKIQVYRLEDLSCIN